MSKKTDTDSFNLRNKLIRLAKENPELRKDLLPLIKVSSGGLKSSVLSAVQEAAKKEVVSWAKEFVKLCNTLTASDLSSSIDPYYFRKGTFTLEKAEVSRVFNQRIDVTIRYVIRGSGEEMKIMYSIGEEKFALAYAWRSNNVRFEAKSPKEVFQAFLPKFSQYLVERQARYLGR